MISYDSTRPTNYQNMMLVIWDLDSIDFVPNPLMHKVFMQEAISICTNN